jgi:hypothetical protein
MVFYDTYKHYKAFIAAGLPEKQAEALVYAIYDVAQEIRESVEFARRARTSAAPASWLKKLFSR